MRALRRREMIAACGAVALLAACGGGESPPHRGPPPIALGLDECAWCRMLIDEDRLVAQFVPADGRASAFGEVGCLLAWLASAPEADGVAWVKALDTGRWQRAETARYATGQVRTPMRFDLTAHTAPPPGGSEDWRSIRGKGAPDARQG